MQKQTHNQFIYKQTKLPLAGFNLDLTEGIMYLKTTFKEITPNQKC